MKFLAINETVNIIVNENEEEINGLKVQLETVKKDLAELKGLQEVMKNPEVKKIMEEASRNE